MLRYNRRILTLISTAAGEICATCCCTVASKLWMSEDATQSIDNFTSCLCICDCRLFPECFIPRSHGGYVPAVDGKEGIFTRKFYSVCSLQRSRENSPGGDSPPLRLWRSKAQRKFWGLRLKNSDFEVHLHAKAMDEWMKRVKVEYPHVEFCVFASDNSPTQYRLVTAFEYYQIFYVI